MLEIKPPLPDSFNSILKPLKYNLSSVSIMRGLTPSMVFTDSLSPTWIVTASNRRIFVSGDIEHPDVVEAVQGIVDAGVKAGKLIFVVYYPSNTENMVVGMQIHGVKPYPSWRNYYTIKPEKTAYPISLPNGFSVEQITEAFLEKEYENTDLVEAEMQSERLSVSDFLEKSFGFCTLKNSVITSWCMSEYNTDNRFEIGIETRPEYRRKGLALQTARACINHGVVKGYAQVGWHCWEKNEPSNRLALSLGFKHKMRYCVEYLDVEQNTLCSR
jgi:RimJ/RimL family protein N-acetyltransferase